MEAKALSRGEAGTAGASLESKLDEEVLTEDKVVRNEVGADAEEEEEERMGVVGGENVSLRTFSVLFLAKVEAIAAAALTADFLLGRESGWKSSASSKKELGGMERLCVSGAGGTCEVVSSAEEERRRGVGAARRGFVSSSMTMGRGKECESGTNTGLVFVLKSLLGFAGETTS